MTIGRPRPLPGYPTTPALYPIPVRRARVQGPQLPSDPTSRWAPLPGLAVPVITARRGLARHAWHTTTALRRTPAESCFWFGAKVLRLVRTHSAISKQPAELGSAERQVAITNF